MAEASGDLTIIEAGPDELDYIVPLFDQYRMFYGQPSDLGLARSFIAARLEQRDSVIFLAVSGEGADEMALGFALLYPSFNSVIATPIWILNDLYVLEGVRRRGVAQSLIEEGRRLAEETGASVISLSTAQDNLPSRRLYERLGFTLDDRFCTYLRQIEQ
jgi:ribosomal protein S18 acetylase RimI-like enzyme